MIEASGLSAGYDGNDHLHNINLSLERGKLTIIIGPNGCGKSTLLKVLSGLLPYTHGSIQLDGKPIGAYSATALAQKLAILPQSRNIPAITVERMVLHGRFPYLGYPRRYRGEDYAIAREMLGQVGMAGFSQRQMAALSGGERQKVYLAMALAQQTEIVLLDEPTTFLDVRHQLEVISIAVGLREAGKTVIMVLHDLNLALRCADRLVVMAQGNIVAQGMPLDLVRDSVLDAVFGVETQICRNEQGEIHYAFARKKEEDGFCAF